MTLPLQAFAPAKVNLTLHVTGQRSDGYHLLDSFVMFADLGDHIEIADAGELTLTVTGPMSAGVPTDNSNLVLRAAGLAGMTKGAINLDKHLPAAAGIGGGSSDAAALLRALGTDLPDEGVSLGADLPVCRLACAARMSGIGEVVTPVPTVPKVSALLVNPGVTVSTPDVFRALENKNNPDMGPIPDFRDFQSLVRWLSDQRNDLETPAVAIQPVISDCLDRLTASGAPLSRMSGSGATCFGLFSDLSGARRAATDIARQRPDWWVRPVMLN